MTNKSITEEKLDVMDDRRKRHKKKKKRKNRLDKTVADEDIQLRPSEQSDKKEQTKKRTKVSQAVILDPVSSVFPSSVVDDGARKEKPKKIHMKSKSITEENVDVIDDRPKRHKKKKKKERKNHSDKTVTGDDGKLYSSKQANKEERTKERTEISQAVISELHEINPLKSCVPEASTRKEREKKKKRHAQRKLKGEDDGFLAAGRKRHEEKKAKWEGNGQSSMSHNSEKVSDCVSATKIPNSSGWNGVFLTASLVADDTILSASEEDSDRGNFTDLSHFVRKRLTGNG
mmetsp:Transcript_35973/g.83977  ORF Transcript_35973/g.83977 Transcript_35973/m.83977 type:complete len:288 (-) Transcript_35973:669-1532(-)|eukprot:CAMPEP_0113303920 /NCGR_PEP_ID=MMETSP0010_2-20120614/4130_1 /TAXON_ID=216773 ORGANISM="Corethron hystrix, Strain 308" /NCGR_SAMPLE_ID=MMETSP0010_2 /ASSEMBLY_ACC=CAM_ASM_000155 /LENGTH=287 /DNA_ID=CAMNT_0000157987 /DNA_START=456 /DNA_END=1319 /DNA_ORIENTATION=- /assembly_acc=CAM_ASM_000155